jgi:hypothetical protein
MRALKYEEICSNKQRKEYMSNIYFIYNST